MTLHWHCQKLLSKPPVWNPNESHFTQLQDYLHHPDLSWHCMVTVPSKMWGGHDNLCKTADHFPSWKQFQNCQWAKHQNAWNLWISVQFKVLLHWQPQDLFFFSICRYICFSVYFGELGSPVPSTASHFISFCFNTTPDTSSCILWYGLPEGQQVKGF